jgi:hypothetical protein
MANEQLEMQDCYHKADEGEPKFTLLARDPLAPWLVGIWVAMSRGDTEGALGAFYGMVDTCSTRYKNEPRAEGKIHSAEDIETLMRNYRHKVGLK